MIKTARISGVLQTHAAPNSMKYVIVIPDGCADEPQNSLDGKTPLEAACVPAMDRIASLGMVGRSNNVPDTLPAGSAVANMSLLGYDPEQYFTGRAPLEAAAGGTELGEHDWAIRCNLVTIEDQIMRDFTAGHVSTVEATSLLSSLKNHLQVPQLQWVPGVGYRNLLIYRGASDEVPFSKDTVTTPPHDLTDKEVLNYYPRGPGSDRLNSLMCQSIDVFRDHEVNLARRRTGKLPVTNIWLWGQGSRPALTSFADRFGITGTMITAVDLLRGLAAVIDWNILEVPGATGYTDTDYAAKGQAAINALATTDLICVHIEATDEASHEGDVGAKIEALEQIDEKIVAPLFQALQETDKYRILVTPDHPTPVRTKTHSHGFVPLAIAGTQIEADTNTHYDERTAGMSELAFDEGHRLMEFFLGN
ncbi:MAG: cofactor-independent phosphoglycerate mutase [Pirellulales bacterium]|nr:cofactor-independent phosphoglycerate mutase [Pirellulales bacterium]